MSVEHAGGWPTLPLGDLLLEVQPGFASGTHNSAGDGIPHLRPMNVSREGRIDRTVLTYVDPIVGRPSLRLQHGDVLFNNTNSPELVGKTALFEGEDAPAFSNHMTRLRVDLSRLSPEFLALRLHQAWREGWFAEHCNNHVSQASIGRDVLRGFPIQLPPLEMQRVIAKLGRSIDERRRSSVGHLAIARRAIERFRQAVLAAACSGHLTVDWRKANLAAPSVEHALAELAATTPRKKRRYVEAPDLSLPELPESYVVGTVADTALRIEYGTSRRAEVLGGGVPVLRMGNIQDGILDVNDLKYCQVDDEIERLILEDGDLLFNRTNSPELVGKSAVFHEAEPMTFASYLIRVRFAPNIAQPDFVNYWINSAWGRAWARLVKSDGVSQSNINGTKLGGMPIPLPPIEEQREIVRRASQMLALGDGLVGRVDAGKRHVDRASQAALAKAFRGDLLSAGRSI